MIPTTIPIMTIEMTAKLTPKMILKITLTRPVRPLVPRRTAPDPLLDPGPRPSGVRPDTPHLWTAREGATSKNECRPGGCKSRRAFNFDKNAEIDDGSSGVAAVRPPFNHTGTHVARHDAGKLGG